MKRGRLSVEDALTYTLTSGDVAELFGVTLQRIQQLDDELKPIRKANGYRRYSPEIIAGVFARRQAARGEGDKP